MADVRHIWLWGHNSAANWPIFAHFCTATQTLSTMTVDCHKCQTIFFNSKRWTTALL